MGRVTIKEIKSQKAWDLFAGKFSPNNFLASWQWADFNDAMGDKTLRLGIYENETLIGICSTSIVISKKGKFLLSPAGPLLLKNNKVHWIKVLDYLRVVAKEENCKFIRIRPLLENTKTNINLLESLGYTRAPVSVPAELTLTLDLKKTEEQLLSEMRKTTRYLIRKSGKEGLEVKTSNKIPDLKIYFELEKSTIAKHKFTPFSNKYIKTQFEIFAKTGDAIIILAKYRNEFISCAIITFFRDSGFYNHGSSIETKIPGSYAVQWEAIKQTKKRCKKFYNFWGGITDDPDDPWYGISLFKAGFGGQRYETIHAYDLPISKLYKPIAFFESVRYKLRGHKL